MNKRLKIYILGSGSLGRLIVDIIESGKAYSVGGFFDDNYPDIRKVLNYPIIGKISDINVKSNPNLAIGIGEPKYRKEMFEKIIPRGYKFQTFLFDILALQFR